MASLFTSCPTFLLSQLRCFFLEKEDTLYPICITIWPLYDPVRHDASVWPGAGSHIGHFCPIRILCYDWLTVNGAASDPGDVIGVASRSERKKTKTKNITAKYITIKKQTKYGQSLNLWNWTMSHFSWFIVFCWRVTLQLSRCVFLMLKRHFFYPLPLFPDNSGRLELFTGHWQRREVK